MSNVSIFGIRHHGPGSARSLLGALEALDPDCVLVEGPPDADGVLPLLIDEGMDPPVAILVYQPGAVRHSVFYPFAGFSPEWQAIRFALERQLPVRFIDLPQSHQIALQLADEDQAIIGPEANPDPEASSDIDASLDVGGATEPADDSSTADAERGGPTSEDPLGWLGRAAGYADGEDWWENMVEQRLDGADLFAAIHEAMALLREEFPRPIESPEGLREARREAFMRRSIRQAQKAGFERIAVVCGAWHAPALTAKVKIKDDNVLLKGLPKVKVEATWVPWTYGRLAASSGYGAGVESPGWYEHLWSYGALSPAADTVPLESRSADSRPTNQIAIRWLTRVARLLRERDLDCSSAHVIEAVRLAESLAALRHRPIPSLAEMNEASLTVMCFGESAPLRLIHDQLSVGERLGSVPKSTPMVPLQRDLEAQQRRLRLKPAAHQQTLDLDLRKASGLQRSHLLHRLALLEIPWGERIDVGGKKGTFHEIWNLQWRPEFSVRVIEAAIWGNTVLDAATSRVLEQTASADLATVSSLVDQVLLAELGTAIDAVMERLEHEAARASDISQLIDAVAPLANILRYGNVRKTETSMIERVVEGLVTRVCVGLGHACTGLDETAANHMGAKIARLDRALTMLHLESHLESWYRALHQVMSSRSVHGLLAGRCCRLLLDARAVEIETVEREMSLALSRGQEPASAAAWLEGFLTGSGMVLLHDDRLWGVLDEWVSSLGGEAFLGVLPLVRRTFSTFQDAERRQMGQRVKVGRRPSVGGSARLDINAERGARALPLIRLILNLEEKNE